jgi:NAD(P)-dependent dehydrogenase (short-subunit alcohol dehydrogenase family)
MNPEATIPQLFDLTGKTALISGASGWLGSAMSRALAEAGANVITTSRDTDRARDAAAALPAVGAQTHYGVALDHLDEGSIESGFAAALACTGRIDILINNGHAANGSDLSTVTADEFNRSLANATGYFLLARKVHDHAVARGGGASIVMIGSMYGVVGSYPEAYEGAVSASPVAYHALKGGIVHMTRHLAVYWAKEGVRVNCLSPGPFPGPAANATMVERLTAKSPMGRIGRPDELKGAVVFLASEASSYITGQNLLVDGGWTAW